MPFTEPKGLSERCFGRCRALSMTKKGRAALDQLGKSSAGKKAERRQYPLEVDVACGGYDVLVCRKE